MNPSHILFYLPTLWWSRHFFCSPAWHLYVFGMAPVNNHSWWPFEPCLVGLVYVLLCLNVGMCAGCEWWTDRISYDFDWFDIRWYNDSWYQLRSCCIFILISDCPPCKCYKTWYDKSRCKKRLMILPPFPIRCGTLAGSIKHQEQKQELMAEVFQQDQTGRF